ncbi:ABC transporter substrate-binding protein [Streptomyces finlayi]|nr:ABC transporter substrate-binding protein [Streptomyces finlayi]
MTARTPRRSAARSRIAAVGALAVAGALVLTGCGDQTKAKDPAPAGSDGKSAAGAPLANLVPKEIAAKGVIKVGSDISYAPVEFKDKDGKVVGIDPDIAAALGKQLGVKFEFENGDFDALVTGLRAKRYDLLMSAMTDTKDRQEGTEDGKKVGEGVDFVDYYTAGVSLYTPKGKTQNIKSWDDLCGKKIVVQRGTVSADLAKAQSEKCEKAGKGKITVEAFTTDQQAQTRLRSGGADAGSSDSPVTAYAVKTSGGGNDFEKVGEDVDAAPYGIAISKQNKDLTKAIEAALKAIIANGDYKKALANWGGEAGAVTDVKINGGS